MAAKHKNITRPSLWVMENLAGSGNFQLGIPDTILFKDGAPQAWLFTSKSGEVLKKRSLRKSSVKERFTRLFASNPNNPQQRMATVRFMDGTVRILGRDLFKEMMMKFPATEPGIMSVQCYLQGKGTAGTVYRNSYRVVNDKGLVVTGTSSFTTLTVSQAAPPPLTTWSERDIKLEKCNASAINLALDKVTLGLVRFLEAEQHRPTRILHLQCDYVVDPTGRIWLTWIGDTTIAVGDAAQDLRLANVALEGPRGRGEFLGPQTALAMQREFGAPPAPVKKTRRSNDRQNDGADEQDISEAIDRAAEVMELPRFSVGAGGSGGIADALSRADGAKNASASENRLSLTTSSTSSTALVQKQNVDTRGKAAALSTMTVGVRAGEASEARNGSGACGDRKGYPSSFACAGEYCRIRVLDPREDADNPQNKRDPNGSLLESGISDEDFFMEVATRLFSGQELSALRRDASFRRQIEEGLVMEVEESTRREAGQDRGAQQDGVAAAGTTGEGLSGVDGCGGVSKRDPFAGGLKYRNPRDWFEVSLKSISLAKNERTNRGRSIKEARERPTRSGTAEFQEREPLELQRRNENLVNGNSEGDREGGAEGGTKRTLQETEASAMRQHARKREDEFLEGGAQNFYKSVRVCGSCFRVYALLDRARVVIASQEALAADEAIAREQSDLLDPPRSVLPRRRRRGGPRGNNPPLDGFQVQGSEYPLSLSSDEMQTSRMADTRSGETLQTRPRSHGDDGRYSKERRKRSLPESLGCLDPRNSGTGSRQQVTGSGTGRRGDATWRGRLEAGEQRSGYEKAPSLPSGKKFEDLDNYLRGSAATAAAKRAKRTRGRGGVDGSLLNSSGGGSSLGTGGGAGESSISTIRTEEDVHERETELFQARVLLAEADAPSAKRTKEMLEHAGYMVTVEGDGKQVLEMLFNEDGEWDALLVERDLPVMDGFGIADALRDFEKARRNRASTIRAVAVEEHGRAADKSRGHGIERDDGAPSSVPKPFEIRHLPIICLSSKASTEDLRSYMAAGMDGCVSKPTESGPLLNTLRAAVPLHLSPASPIDGRPLTIGSTPTDGIRGGGITVVKGRGLGVLKGSAACAAAGMVLPARSDDSVEGALQVDADTLVPYCIVGAPPSAFSGSSVRFFNLVVCHDLFDNYERMKIVVAPVIARYPGAQVLFWNYPGQAFSEWREQQLLNNEYLATILQYLLLHLGGKSSGGTGEFDSDRPYHLVGFGSGGAVATFYASHFTTPSPRSLLLLNSFSYVDAYLAGVLHDCMNVFSCAPESRPDLPVYFHARFLFSPAYLGQVSTPLALNLYTAVHNPISVKGRIQLCKGALAHVDTRPVLSEIEIPVTCIQSTQNNFVKPLHTDPYVSRRGGEVRSIHKALQDPSKTCVVWINAGHEIFQEARVQTTTLLEQAISGYHEGNDVVYAMSRPEFLSAATSARSSNAPGVAGARASRDRARESRSRQTSTGNRGEVTKDGRIGGDAFEDGYIDSVLSTMGDIESETRHRERGDLFRSSARGGNGSKEGSIPDVDGRGDGRQGEGLTNTDNMELGPAWDGNIGEVYGSSWENYRASVAAAATNTAARRGGGGMDGGGGASDDEERWQRGGGGDKNRRKRRGRRHGGGEGGAGAQGRNIMVGTVLDASHPAFERQDNLVYGFGQGSKVYPQPEEFPEVKEYMAWRLKRNRKRLIRLDRAARRIQGLLRAYLAQKRVQSMREGRACVYIQRIFRGWRGRLMFLEKLRSVWAAQVVQRNWRGHASRRWFQLLRRQQAACGHIQRVSRGALVRQRVRATRSRRDHAAALMQALWRGVAGRRYSFRCREEYHGAITIQRVFRGHTGRRRAGRERDKYLFSKSQSQGIEFGRQMLLEHKLHATRLQSDVQLLTGEKVSAEEAVEAVMEEISEFEEAVSVLEREMHQLSKIETEAVGVLDEEARLELREQKVRLDKEFGEMLGKIADRKERLLHMEKKLATLDRTRLGKEEDLRTLERKLVVLLEEQQRELESIRRRQEKKGKLLLGASGGSDGGLGSIAGGGIGGGPSAKDKRQAAQLMQSTETLMKFGFMSMSMTYFSSLNMIRAMRSVGATDTVMAALAHNANAAEAHGAGGGGSGGDGDDGRALALEKNEKLGAEPFRPALKPGQLPGQQPLAVAAWSVDDVAGWLQTLTLTQYREAFISAAVDGAFLYDLNDDDLKSSLGVEHRLHRKKIINSILRLKAAEAERTRPVSIPAALTGRNDAIRSPETLQELPFGTAVLGDASEALGRVGTADGGGTMGNAGGSPAVPIHFKELAALTRRGKYRQAREILQSLPDRRFDDSIVRVPYVPDYGTAYVDAYEQEPFNLNKIDDHGNTLLMVAAQNGNVKLAKLFVQKGCNPNHQNKAGQTAGHYAVSYQFFDFSEWLFQQDGTGAEADDTLENAFGLGVYDGLQAESGGGGGDASEPLMLEAGG